MDGEKTWKNTGFLHAREMGEAGAKKQPFQHLHSTISPLSLLFLFISSSVFTYYFYFLGYSCLRYFPVYFSLFTVN